MNTLRELGPMIAEHVLCDEVPRALVAWNLGHSSADAELERARDEFHEVQSMQQYIMWHVAEHPPDDPAALEEILERTERTAVLISELTRMIRPDYVEMYEVDPAAPPGYLDGVLGNAALTTAVGFGKELHRADTGLLRRADHIADELLERMARLLGNDSRFSRFLVGVSRNTTPTPRAAVGTALGCSVTLVKAVGATYADDSHEDEFATTEIIRGLTALARENLLDVWHRHYGEAPPPVPDCTLDLFEPNERWSRVASTPVGTLGGAPIDDISLCLPDGTGDEVDWYAFSMPFLSYDVEAHLTGVDGGVGQDARICMDIWYWDEALEIIGDPPTPIRSTTCGEIGTTGVTIPRFGVSRTTGVSWSTLFVRVTPETPGTTPEGVDYQLAFDL